MATSVLLTRGMKGTILYSTDAETQEMLESVIGAQRSGPDLTWSGLTASSETLLVDGEFLECRLEGIDARDIRQAREVDQQIGHLVGDPLA